jgi:LysR family hydrogen peroxide-inducible transcriptional activator
MVAAGLGCTLLPALAVPHLTARHKQLEVRPLIAAKAHRRIGLLWRASFPQGEDLREFGRFILGQLPDSVEPIGAPGGSGGEGAAGPRRHGQRSKGPGRAGFATAR